MHFRFRRRANIGIAPTRRWRPPRRCGQRSPHWRSQPMASFLRLPIPISPPAVVPPADATAEPAHRQAACYVWALLLVRIYEVLPLLCPRCGGATRIIAFITEAAAIQAILGHLGEPKPPPRLRPAQRRRCGRCRTADVIACKRPDHPCRAERDSVQARPAAAHKRFRLRHHCSPGLGIAVEPRLDRWVRLHQAI